MGFALLREVTWAKQLGDGLDSEYCLQELFTFHVMLCAPWGNVSTSTSGTGPAVEPVMVARGRALNKYKFRIIAL